MRMIASISLAAALAGCAGPNTAPPNPYAWQHFMQMQTANTNALNASRAQLFSGPQRAVYCQPYLNGVRCE